MHVKPIGKAYFSMALAAVSTLCVALCWMGSAVPRPCIGSDSAEAGITVESVGAEAAQSAGKLTITTYAGSGEGHLITFPDSTTLGIDCASGTITALSHYHSDHCADNPHQFARDNVSLGQVVYDKDGATVTVVAANGRVIGDADGDCTSSDENACSMVLWVKYKGFDYLAGGDLTGSKEGRLGDALAARGVHIDVYKVHHHGSSGSSYTPFLQDILPEYAVVSGGASSLKDETLGRLKSAGVKMIYDTFNDQSDPQFKYSGGDIKITTDGHTYSFSAPNFNDGPYEVDEYVPPENPPPHLLISEVAVGAHQAPENHDWIELYLPLDASSVKLNNLYWTDMDDVRRAAAGTTTLAPGDVVILHDASGVSDDDVSGKGPDGRWDIFVDGSKANWSATDEPFVICSQNSVKPSIETIIDAVVWSNYDGIMYEPADANYLISSYQWGDPAVGSGTFSSANETPAIGSISDGYAQRITTIDTNSKGDWRISSTHSQGTPPPTPTPTPTSTPTPPPFDLTLNTSSPSAGETFTVRAVVQPITGRPFDAYAVIIGNGGTFSIQAGNRLKRGIFPFVRNIRSLPNGYSGVLLNMSVPQGVGGDYRVIAGLVDTGGTVRGPSSAFAGDTEYFTVK